MRLSAPVFFTNQHSRLNPLEPQKIKVNYFKCVIYNDLRYDIDRKQIHGMEAAV